MDLKNVKLPRYSRPLRQQAPQGTLVGEVVELDTFGGKGPARYEGKCVACRRDLFSDPSDRLSLGVNERCSYTEFPDVPVCFECQSERKLYDALCFARDHKGCAHPQAEHATGAGGGLVCRHAGCGCNENRTP